MINVLEKIRDLPNALITNHFSNLSLRTLLLSDLILQIIQLFLYFSDLLGIVAEFDGFRPGGFGLFEALRLEVKVADVIVHRGVGGIRVFGVDGAVILGGCAACRNREVEVIAIAVKRRANVAENAG